MKKIASLISWFFHPVWLVSIGTYLVFSFHGVLHSKLSQLNLIPVWILIFFSSAVLPVMSAMLFLGIKNPNELTHLNKLERNVFILSGLVYQLLLAYMFYKAGITLFVFDFFIGNAAVLLAAIILNNFTRISLHAMGWGGLTAMLSFLFMAAPSHFFWLIILSIFISGAVMSSRLILGAHTRFQIYLGYSTAYIVMTLIFIIHGYRI